MADGDSKQSLNIRVLKKKNPRSRNREKQIDKKFVVFGKCFFNQHFISTRIISILLFPELSFEHVFIFRKVNRPKNMFRILRERNDEIPGILSTSIFSRPGPGFCFSKHLQAKRDIPKNMKSGRIMQYQIFSLNLDYSKRTKFFPELVYFVFNIYRSRVKRGDV